MAYPQPEKTCAQYPFPVVAPPGPDCIGLFADKAFFTAPECGRVGILDVGSEKIIGSVELGGYLTDLVVDAARAEVFLSDAARNRIVILDANDGKLKGEITVPEFPRSIALHNGRLFVACALARKVVGIDVASRKTAGSVDFPAMPRHVEIQGEPARLAVSFLPATFDPRSLKEFPADRLTYWPNEPHPGFDIKAGPFKDEAPKANSRRGRNNQNLSAKALEKIASIGGDIADVAVLGDRKPAGFVLDSAQCNANSNGPGEYYTPQKASVSNRLYAVDSKGSRLVVLDLGTLEVLQEIKLAAEPVSAQFFGLELFVLSRSGRTVTAVDVNENKVLRELPLPMAPERFMVAQLLDRDTACEFQPPYVQSPIRVIVDYAPLAFEPGGRNLGGGPARAPRGPRQGAAFHLRRRFRRRGARAFHRAPGGA